MRLLAAFLIAQTLSPVFDAASVKLNRSGGNGKGGMIGIGKGGIVSMRNVTPELLISTAFEVPPYQMGGLPAWANSTRYDVEAKPDHAVDYNTGRLMLQNLLADRFSMQVHHEQAAVNVFNLVIDKGGFKLKVSEAPGIGFRLMGPDRIQGPGDMRMLTNILRGVVHAPVEDRTGLTGKYDIDLPWTREGASPTDEPSVSIFAALQAQLGLKLDATKVTVDRVVIDRLERPTEN
jgi:uncharacterized protein (TIGR03435 family)